MYVDFNERFNMKLVRNYLYNAGYQILLLITPLLTVPYISRVLGPTGVGINATTNSVITYFLLLGTLGVTIYGNREIAGCREDIVERSKKFWEIEIMQVCTIAIAYCIFLGWLFFTTQFKMYFFLQSFLILAGAFDISWYFMGLEDFKKTVLRNTMVKLLSLVFIFTLVKDTSDTGIYILILSVSQLIGNITLWPYLKDSVRLIRLRDLHIWSHFRPSVALFIPQIAIQIYVALNRTMLWKLDSVTSSGYYDYADKLIKLVLALVTATGIIMLPRIANLFTHGEIKKVHRYLYVSFDFVSSIAFPLALGVAATATSLAPWFFGKEFSSVGILLIIESPIIIFIGWSNVIGQQYLIPTRQVKQYTQSVSVGAIVNIILNVPLIIILGVRGAAIATLISEFVVTGYQLFVVRKQLTLSKLFSNCLKYMIAAVAMFLIVFPLNLSMKISVLSLAGQIGEGALIYVGALLILQPSLMQEIKYILKD